MRASLLLSIVALAACSSEPAASDSGIGDHDDAGPLATTDGGPLTAPDSGPPLACDEAPPQSGEGTYYAADGSGACGFPPSPGDLMVAAMNAPQFDGSGVCGMCARVTGPNGEITVRIVDLCPECASGDLDLSPQAFDMIADHSAGRVPITWHEVPCDVTGPLVWHFKDGANQWWTALQVRNHRNRIARVEAQQSDGSWAGIERLDYNYFVDADGLGTGPYALRAIDVHGNVVEDTGVPLLDDADHASAGQLPACE